VDKVGDKVLISLSLKSSAGKSKGDKKNVTKFTRGCFDFGVESFKVTPFIRRRYRVTKKNPWILGLSLVALTFGPALPALAADSKADSKTTPEAAAADASSEKAEKAETAAKEPKDDGKTEKANDAKPAAKHKSPVLAGALGFFPGIAVHGSGHMYAGSWMKGLGLLAIEGAAIGIASAQISGGTDDIQKIADGMSSGKFPTDASGAFTKTGILIVSLSAFLWTWFDDMAGAPIAAKEYNKLQDEKSQARLQLQPREDGAALAFSASF